MKRIIILVCICCSTLLYGQDYKLIYPIANQQTRENSLQHQIGMYRSIDFINIDLSEITRYEYFVLEYRNKSVQIKKDKIQFRDSNSYSFWGSSDNGETIFLSVLNENIQGILEDTDGVFSIETIRPNLYAIIDFDYSELENQHSEQYLQNKEYKQTTKQLTQLAQSTQGLNSNCKIRVLVLYTSQALGHVSDIKNTIFTAIDATNTSFANSNINYRIELAYMGLTNYVESGNYRVDLNSFVSKNDGNIDAVHSLRNKYAADICILLTYEKNTCGIASGIGGGADNAFCIVSVYNNCATANYSFGHEIGHLLGCRHDIAVDNTNTPFPYGHGYINSSKTWRTIMAYGNGCNNCPRKNFWSNPDVSIGGIPTGTENLQNNARVWNEQAYTIMGFRQPENNISMVSGDIENSQYADIIAKQNVNIGALNIKSGQSLHVKASREIVLSSGFSVENGAEFSASITFIDNCGN